MVSGAVRASVTPTVGPIPLLKEVASGAAAAAPVATLPADTPATPPAVWGGRPKCPAAEHRSTQTASCSWPIRRLCPKRWAISVFPFAKMPYQCFFPFAKIPYQCFFPFAKMHNQCFFPFAKMPYQCFFPLAKIPYQCFFPFAKMPYQCFFPLAKIFYECFYSLHFPFQHSKTASKFNPTNDSF